MRLKKLSKIKNLPEQLKIAKREYKFPKELLAELDSYKDDFDDFHILKIVLWKLNRYPKITAGTIKTLNDLKNNYKKDKVKNCIIELLNIHGFNLPMASTVLRFLMPERFQIIDQRAYRLLYGKELKLSSVEEKKADLYLEYLSELRKQCRRYKINFKEADRILYSLDKILNKENLLKSYGAKKSDLKLIK